ncbi:hypothetical protein AK812_SmicGene34984 [Symbiodinium microadriaticum]|uniref:Uncharacterized protein n=1 Tax=Symbiodinium microadriaticum TaxID=2951 RepID=A0A1Q9CMP0_SYMMI|nr:hypothetical protein AK812_SmicGene34984 [Symbiodinium microadriaticum]CAE6928745.1 unnamed protein product [Symbiodinium sp. KB8]CAE7287145.1 unnamed protein product [Symbiodinium microadriaticum]
MMLRWTGAMAIMTAMKLWQVAAIAGNARDDDSIEPLGEDYGLADWQLGAEALGLSSSSSESAEGGPDAAGSGALPGSGEEDAEDCDTVVSEAGGRAERCRDIDPLLGRCRGSMRSTALQPLLRQEPVLPARERPDLRLR